MKLNLFAPITPGADRAEADQGLITLVNGYVDQMSGQPSVKTRPGLKEMHTTANATRVSLYWWEAKRIMVIANGDRIYAKTSKKGSLIEISPAAVDDRFPKGVRVFFSADEHGVTMSAGLFMLWWDGETTHKAIKITDAAAPGTITSLTYLKGYTIASILNTQQFAYAVYGPLDSRAVPPPWSPLYVSAAASPDDIQCLGAGWEELFILGRESAQSHYASGDATIPFPPLNGSVVETGIMNSECLQKLGNSWIFYTPHKQVVRVQGRTPAIISQSIEQELRRLTYFDKVHTYTLFNRFYVLNFYADQKTMVYDQDTNLWYRWGAWDETYKKYKRFIGFSAAYAKAWGQQYVGSFDGRIYEMSYDFTHDQLQPIRMSLRSAHIDHGTSARKFSPSLSMRLLRGTSPTVILSESDERTFKDDWTAISQVGAAAYDIFYASNGYTYITGSSKIWRTLDMTTFEECTLTGVIDGQLAGTLAEASNGRIVTNDCTALWICTDGITFVRSATHVHAANYFSSTYPLLANPEEPYVYVLGSPGLGLTNRIYRFDLDGVLPVTTTTVVNNFGGVAGSGAMSNARSITGTMGIISASHSGGSDPFTICRCSGGVITHQTSNPGYRTDRTAIIGDSNGLRIKIVYSRAYNGGTAVTTISMIESLDGGQTFGSPVDIDQNHWTVFGGIALNDGADFAISWDTPRGLQRLNADGTSAATLFAVSPIVYEFTRKNNSIYGIGTASPGTVYRMTSDPAEIFELTPDDPAKLLIRWRNDGRQDWSNYREIDLGNPGQTEIVKHIRGLGQYRTRQYEIVSYTGVSITMTGVEENVTSTNP